MPKETYNFQTGKWETDWTPPLFEVACALVYDQYDDSLRPFDQERNSAERIEARRQAAVCFAYFAAPVQMAKESRHLLSLCYTPVMPQGTNPTQTEEN